MVDGTESTLGKPSLGELPELKPVCGVAWELVGFVSKPTTFQIALVWGLRRQSCNSSLLSGLAWAGDGWMIKCDQGLPPALVFMIHAFRWQWKDGKPGPKNVSGHVLITAPVKGCFTLVWAQPLWTSAEKYPPRSFQFCLPWLKPKAVGLPSFTGGL